MVLRAVLIYIHKCWSNIYALCFKTNRRDRFFHAAPTTPFWPSPYVFSIYILCDCEWNAYWNLGCLCLRDFCLFQFLHMPMMNKRASKGVVKLANHYVLLFVTYIFCFCQTKFFASYSQYPIEFIQVFSVQRSAQLVLRTQWIQFLLTSLSILVYNMRNSIITNILYSRDNLGVVFIAQPA